MDIIRLNELFDNGTLKTMYKSGLVTQKIFFYREIYLWVDAQMVTRGISKNKAVLEAEVKFGVSETTVWRALSSYNMLLL